MNGAGGMLAGGAVGAVLGSAIAGSDHHYRYGYYGYHRHSGDRAAGAIIGGVLGAVAGGALASSNC